MNNLTRNPITVTDVANSKISIMTNLWSLFGSIQTLKNEIQNPTTAKPNDTFTPLQHAQSAVIENAVMTLTSFIQLANLGEDTSKNYATEFLVATYRLVEI